MDYFFLALIPMSFLLPPLMVGITVYVCNSNLKNKHVIALSYVVFISLIASSYFFPDLLAGESLSKSSNVALEWLKLMFFGKEGKIERFEKDGFQYATTMVYFSKFATALISAWFASKCYSVVKWLASIITTKRQSKSIKGSTQR
jgi:hypothetical protein